MMIDVTFSQTDMGFEPTFGTNIQMPGGGTGVVFVPAVTEDGILSWINNGDLPNPPPVNIKGRDGHSPVKGTDYWTEADRMQMVADVVNALPLYNGEVVE